MKGITKWFDNKKGYGFVVDEHGGEHFVHHSAIKGNGYKTLEEGETVEFGTEATEKGNRATWVNRVTQGRKGR